MAIIEKNICIKHHGREVFGTAYLPEESSEYPLVIFSHGYNGSGTDFRDSAMELVHNGIGAVSYDFCGGSVNQKNNFETTQMTIFTEKEDLNAVLDEVREWEMIDKDNIFAFGGSQGGLVTSLVAEERMNQIRGMILLFPALCIPDNWRDRFPRIEDIPNELDLWGMKIGKVFFESIRDFYVFDHIGKYPNKVLLMQGDKDVIVAMNYAKKAKEIYSDIQMEVFEGEGHGFSPDGNKKMTEMLIAFINQCLI